MIMVSNAWFSCVILIVLIIIIVSAAVHIVVIIIEVIRIQFSTITLPNLTLLPEDQQICNEERVRL